MGGGQGEGVVSACGTFEEGFEIRGLGMRGKGALRIGRVREFTHPTGR